MELRIIEDIAVYDKFVLNSPYVHYTKTSMWANTKKMEHYKAHYIGFYINNELVGCALGLENHFYLHKYLYIPNGMCINYNDIKLLQDCLKLLIEYARKLNVCFLRIDPNVIRCSRDIDGNKITGGIDNEIVTDTFKAMGFRHKGYNFAYDGSWYNRYTLAIDISKDIQEIKKHFNKQRITALNRHNVIGVSCHVGNENDINDLMLFEKQLAAIQGFKPHSYEFFKNILDNFKDHARLYVVTLNIDKMIEGITNELNSKKYAKDLEARKAKENELAKAYELKKKYPDNIVKLACGLFVYYGYKSFDLYTYNHKDFNYLKPVDNLHYFALSDLKDHKVTYYDMCGFSGLTNKDDPHYGLYSYKKSFGSQFIEHIGEFDYVYDDRQYLLFKKCKSLNYHYHHFLNNIIYKKDKS